MRHIGSIPSTVDAEAFSDYLLAQGIPNMVEESPDNGAWAVWIENDDHMDRGKSELASFLSNPSDIRYRAAVRTAEKIREQREKKQRRLRKHFVDVRTSWGQPAQWKVPVTLTLMSICVIVAFATQLGRQMHPVGDWLRIESTESFDRAVEEIRQGAQPSAATIRDLQRLMRESRQLSSVRRGQVWRLITPIFLHFSILHLIFNMFWLRDLGAMIETRRGSWRLLGIVLAAAVIGNLAEYAWSGPLFGGMSGVVYALFGYVWIKSRFEPQSGMGVSQETAWIMIAWLVLCMTGIVGAIANAAHLAGLLTGAAIAYAPIAARRARR